MKQEPAEETTVISSLPPASENPENAAGNTAADKKSLSIDEAKKFTAKLRCGENDPTKTKDPVALAEETFINLTQKLIKDFPNLSIEGKNLGKSRCSRPKKTTIRSWPTKKQLL